MNIGNRSILFVSLVLAVIVTAVIGYVQVTPQTFKIEQAPGCANGGPIYEIVLSGGYPLHWLYFDAGCDYKLSWTAFVIDIVSWFIIVAVVLFVVRQLINHKTNKHR